MTRRPHSPETIEKMKASHAARRNPDPEALLMSEAPRPEMRADPRPDDPRARAAARTKQLLEHGALDVDTTDEFRIEPGMIPDGWSYEWKRRTVLNAEDPAYQVGLSATGWEPVERGRHPEMMPEGWSGKTIERKGMVLMERPKEITDHWKRKAEGEARQQVQNVEDSLAGAKPGQFDRVDGKGNSTVKLAKSYSPMQIPD